MLSLTDTTQGNCIADFSRIVVNKTNMSSPSAEEIPIINSDIENDVTSSRRNLVESDRGNQHTVN